MHRIAAKRYVLTMVKLHLVLPTSVGMLPVTYQYLKE